MIVDAETKLPQFVKCLDDVEVTDGQEVMLFCVVSGEPMPAVTWYHNNKNIVKNEEYVFTYDRQTGHIYLVILDCLVDDEGEFQCVATNSAGQAVTQCNLRILPADSIKLSSPTGKPLSINVASVKPETVGKTSGVSPIVSKSKEPKPRSTSALLTGLMPDDAAFNSRLASAESLTLVPPDILFHTKKIPGQSKKVASYRTVLRRASDNDLLGYRAKSAADQPHRQNASWKVSDWSIYTKQTLQKAEEAPAVRGVMSPTQTKIPSESTFFLGGSSSLHAAPVSGFPFFPTAGTESRVPAISSSIKPASYSQPAKVPYIKAPAVEMPATLASSRLFEPPRFIIPLSNQTVRDGDAATLRVRFHGNPTPKLHWFFNQKAVENEEDFVIHTDSTKGESILWIKEVFPEDDGEFVCKAENDYGTAVSLCRLTVKCKHRDFYYTHFVDIFIYTHEKQFFPGFVTERYASFFTGIFI